MRLPDGQTGPYSDLGEKSNATVHLGQVFQSVDLRMPESELSRMLVSNVKSQAPYLLLGMGLGR